MGEFLSLTEAPAMSITLRSLPVLAACFAAGVLRAGDIVPPAGPVDSTMKTLEEVEPRTPIGPETTPAGFGAKYRITSPGTYYLTGNLVAAAGMDGLRIDSSDVTVDLMGFTIQGSGTAAGNTGIYSSALGDDYVHITIRNGFVTGWSGSGVYLGGEDNLLEDLVIADCGGAGAFISSGTTVQRCMVFNTTTSGLNLGANSTVESSIVADCGTNGMTVGSGSVVTGCIAYGNVNNGIVTTDSGTISECVVTRNDLTGIIARRGQVSNCVAYGNLENGIHATRAVSITSCTVSFNGSVGALIDAGSAAADGSLISGSIFRANSGGGIMAGSHCTISGNAVWNNSGGSGIQVQDDCLITMNLFADGHSGHGIQAGDTCRITNNHLVASPGSGIVAEVDSTIERNSVVACGSIGISVDNRCRIVGNNCEGNGSLGIYTGARECTIHDNRVANNVLAGIRCNGDRNFVFANFARDNGGTNYEAVADNRFGPIVIPPLSGAILGSSDPDVLGVGTIDPWANFSY
ncbi:MAG: right-handed parallel beta-helix repeat-containing protein [Phycisphaerales bacterium]|nr:right-handed parallel beta-helix repeat-containing protein [Phycisphaerales bacterium]